MGRGYKDGGKPKMGRGYKDGARIQRWGASQRWGQAPSLQVIDVEMGLAPIFDPPQNLCRLKTFAAPKPLPPQNLCHLKTFATPKSLPPQNHCRLKIFDPPKIIAASKSFLHHLVACSLHPPLRLILPVPLIFMPRYVSTNAHQLPRLPVHPIVHAPATRLILPGAGLNG